MSYDEKLLREYVRGLLSEKLSAARSVASGGEGGSTIRATGLSSYKDEHGVERAECKPDKPLTCIASLLGQPQSFVDAIGAIFGEKGLFNISALWKTDVNFLGDETLKPAWDFLMETLATESTPREVKGADFWSNLFGRTSKVAGEITDTPDLPEIPDEIPDIPQGTSLADRVAATAPTTESLMFIFESEALSEDRILSAFSADVSDIASVISSIKSSLSIADAIKMLGDATGHQVDTESIQSAMQGASGSFNSDQILNVFKDTILKEVMGSILDFVSSSISDGSEAGFINTLPPIVKSSMLDMIDNLISSL